MMINFQEIVKPLKASKEYKFHKHKHEDFVRCELCDKQLEFNFYRGVYECKDHPEQANLETVKVQKNEYSTTPHR